MDKILLLEQQEVRPRAPIPKDAMGVASLENKAPGKGTPEGSVGWGPTHYISFLAEAQCDGVLSQGWAGSSPGQGQLGRCDDTATSTHRPYCSVYSDLLQAPPRRDWGPWRAILWVNGYMII